MKRRTRRTLYAAIMAATLVPITATADTGDDWEFSATLYGWFPDLSGRTTFGQDVDVDIGDILDNLKFTFQGNFDARKGNWGVITDVIYLDLDNSQDVSRLGSIGPGDIPAELSGPVGLDVTSWVWNTAGYYRLVSEERNTFDMLVGFRYTDVEQTLSWDLEGDLGQLPLPGRNGSARVAQDFWDLIVGARGRLAFGESGRWYTPYYVDIGTGDSDFTWQAAAGLGYAFDWGNVSAVWRYLDYELPSDGVIQELNFSGPAIGFQFEF